MAVFCFYLTWTPPQSGTEKLWKIFWPTGKSAGRGDAANSKTCRRPKQADKVEAVADIAAAITVATRRLDLFFKHFKIWQILEFKEA